MDGLVALLPTTLLVILILLGSLYRRPLLRRLSRIIPYPRYGITAVCPHCVVPLVASGAHFCPACSLPITGFAATDPILYIATLGAIYRQGSHRLVGVGLAGVCVLCIPSLLFAAGMVAEGQYEGAMGVLISSSPWFFVLFKGVSSRRSSPGVI